MLVRFNVKNFLSFSERKAPVTNKFVSHEFSMIPGKVRLNQDHVFQNKTQNLLRLAAIFGANAAGKSNIIKAFSFFQQMTINGKCPIGATEKYSKIKAENKDNPSYFECEILLENDLYSYGFEAILSTGIIVSEWLSKETKDSVINLFYKDGETDNYHFDGALKDNQDLNTYQKGLMGTNALLLSEMNKDKTGFYINNPKAIILQQVFNWFHNNIEIIYPSLPSQETSFLVNSTSLKEVADLLNSFDTGIVSIDEITEDPDKLFTTLPNEIKQDFIQQIEVLSKVKQNSKTKFQKWSALIRNRNDILGFELNSDLKLKAYSLQFKHRNTDSNIHFRISEESDGTARLFELIEILISQKNKTYLVDELDRCMHPCLTYKFIEKFFEYTKEKKVQLIVTTHESRLMDFKLLRRDEIWFVDKDSTGNSNIYSLEEYNTRFDQKVDKAYLEGRYGGVPLFTTLFPVENKK